MLPLEMEALDATDLIPASSDPMKMLCLAASKLKCAEGEANSGGGPLCLAMADFDAAERKIVSALHGGSLDACTTDTAAVEWFVERQGKSSITFC